MSRQGANFLVSPMYLPCLCTYFEISFQLFQAKILGFATWDENDTEIKLSTRREAKIDASSGTCAIILDRTSFYAEGGGQSSDVGFINGPRGAVFEVTDVQKPLAAVSAIVEAGNEVVFKPGARDSFILNPRTGEKVQLKREKGTYTMEVEVEDAGFSGQA